MIKQMERKFTIVAISVISLVLLVLMILVNVISIGGNISRVDDSLDRLAIEQFDPNFDPKFDIGKSDPPNIIFGIPISKDAPLDTSGIDIKNKRESSKEVNRSFEVILKPDLSFVSTNASLKNIVDDETSYKIALSAVEKNQEYGFVDAFRYLKIVEDEQIKMVFLDYSFERQSELNVMIVSAIVFFAAIILVTILVKIFLKPVMRSVNESYAKQKQFITDASHELKTPLTVISTSMEIIEMENGSSDWTVSVKKQVDKLNTLTNELVTLSRMNEEKIQIEMGIVNLSEIIGDVVMGFEPAIVAKNKRFEVEIENDVRIKGHYDSLERVMSILLNNALKYSDDNGLIQVNLYKKGNKAYLTVMNSVSHIEKGNHDEFFERFYRSDASRNSKTGGFGIGLSVAKATVDEHRGKIEVRSLDEKSIEVVVIFRA